MPLADHGGFDVVIELSEAAAKSVFGSFRITGNPIPFESSNLSGTIELVADVDSVTFVAPDKVVFVLTLRATRILATKARMWSRMWNDVAPGMQQIDLGATSISITGTLRMDSSHRLLVDLSSAVTTASLDEGAITGSPVVTLLLTGWMLEEPTLWENERDYVFTDLKYQLSLWVPGYLPGLVPAFNAPSLLTPSLLTSRITGHAFRILTKSIKVCYTTASLTPASVGPLRSNLTRLSDGTPLDVLALDITNTVVLRDVVAIAVQRVFGIGPAFFVPGHPLLLLSPAPVTGIVVPGIASITCDFILGGMDGTLVRLIISFTAVGRAAAFTIKATVDLAFTIIGSMTPTPSSMSFGFAPAARAPIVSSDLSIAWWVYVGTFLGHAPPSTIPEILAVAEVFKAWLSGLPAAIARRSPPYIVTLPRGTPPLTLRSVSLAQPGAVRRVVTSPFLLLDAFPDNDVIINAF